MSSFVCSHRRVDLHRVDGALQRRRRRCHQSPGELALVPQGAPGAERRAGAVRRRRRSARSVHLAARSTGNADADADADAEHWKRQRRGRRLWHRYLREQGEWRRECELTGE